MLTGNLTRITWNSLHRQKSNSSVSLATVTDEWIFMCFVVWTSHKSVRRVRAQGEERLVLEPSSHLVLVWHRSAGTKKPSVSQQGRFEPHMCLRSYSQLTLTQSRHRKKGTRRSHLAQQTDRLRPPVCPSIFHTSSSFSFPSFARLIFFDDVSPSPLFIPYMHVQSAPSPPCDWCISFVCLVSLSCHSSAPRGLLSRCG